MNIVINPSKINGLLAEKKIKKIVASKHLKIDPKTLRGKLNGLHEFTGTELAMLANLLNVDVSIFFEEKIPLETIKRGKNVIN